MIYSGFVYSFEFSELRIRIQIQPILINSIKKKNLNNYLQFSISYYGTILQ